VAASNEQARLLELFELQHDQGPCRDAQLHSEQVANVELRTAHSRWPTFTPRALADGYASVSAVPLRLRNQVIGALNLFRTAPGALDDEHLLLAQALADSATIGILQQRALHQGEVLIGQLQRALDSRIGIEQAKGVLAERWTLDVDEAFRMLRRYARAHNLKLSDLAEQVVAGKVDTGAMHAGD
jgi:GAF domain-containing protein